MSRIEKAIEAAVRMRNATEAAPAAPRTESGAPPASGEDNASGRDLLLQVEPVPITSPYLAIWQNEEDTVVREEYKKLRSLVEHLTRQETFRNTLMVTSSIGGEGKTITALNLAIALAQQYDHTVLLVDADLRKPSIHQYLGLKEDVGLAQCLSGHATLEQALIKTGIGKLVVLPGGAGVNNQLELLSSNRMKTLIQELKTRYADRYIIFDTAPVLPFADAQVLSSLVDGVIFVVREGMARLHSVKEALASLKGAPFLGAVYNDATFAHGKNHYSSYYY
ncbi:MAG TPA: XrtA-associated tyrosine autokinase [Desulfuromonadales bacterium]|nr:XrtA-associated tyrosine autokinase [Desulfuromonadales bacterium]